MTNYQLKWIAMISMVIDHTGYVFFQASPYYELFRIIGRISFPLYCYLLVEGFFHTSNLKKYWIRMGILAISSQLPFYLIGGKGLNVVFTLFLGLTALIFFKYEKTIPILLCMIVAIFLHTDYSCMGVLLIIIFYLAYWQKHKYLYYAAATGLTLNNIWCIFSIPFLYSYNVKKGNSRLPNLFYYAFYPAHLFIFYLLSLFF